MNLTTYFKTRSARKAAKTLRNEFRLYEDILPKSVCESLETRFIDLNQAIQCEELEDLPQVVETLRAELKAAIPTPRFGFASEWFDIIVSALAVAFCFRAYYYEPFQIPTGSMQPTLYGIHVEEAAQPGAWDTPPLSYLKWCVTGETYTDVRIKSPGVVSHYLPSSKPGYAMLVVNGRDTYSIPDVVMPELLKRLPIGSRVHANQTVWRGIVKSGDFLFVNRWIWNFRHPRLGETIVFSTQELPGLPPNQHYIKRLCGRPGDTVEIKPDSSYLWVNGEAALLPVRLEEIATHASPWEGGPKYPGYKPAAPTQNYQTQSLFNLGPKRYLALGDNSDNSLDSRYWGTVPAKNLLGPATFVHWPFTSPRWGTIR